jgi:hypothetical protein
MAPGGVGFIKQILYKFKLDYGNPIDIYRYGSQTVDTRTGEIDKPKTVINIPLAIILDTGGSKRQFHSTFNRKFDYGGDFDTSIQGCVIDSEDVPIGFEPTLEDYIVHLGKRWAIKSINPILNDCGWYLDIKQTEGTPPEQLLGESVCNDLEVQHGAHND